MAKGRGNIANIILIQSLCMLLFHSLMIQADIYNVGDEKGWTFGVQNWPSGKTFKEGDILVFNYAAGKHNVVVAPDDSCVAEAKTNAYESGADKITLVKGMNYFICGYPRHCNLGMKIAVNAI
ncbi:hypothetical protein TSUD_293910 [Trifolium subterraneum]|uniref:Basic blue protein n=1 Tax=Trifolium subterraneum TaxID=3900 RepID=A0A2Z6M3G7_TRISU|nr:hypothetical protein TSUD_293910 [Trifolium subterraneum]